MPRTRQVSDRNVDARLRVLDSFAVPPRFDRDTVITTDIRRIFDQDIATAVWIIAIRVGSMERRFNVTPSNVNIVAIINVDRPIRGIFQSNVVYANVCRVHELDQVASGGQVLSSPMLLVPIVSVAINDTRRRVLPSDREICQVLPVQETGVTRTSMVTTTSVTWSSCM